MTRCKILGLMMIALLFAAAAPALAEAASPAAPPAVTAPAIADCGLDFGLTGQLCPAAQPESLVPEFMAKPPRIRYCSCGCGATCTTDADCDGGVCVNVITCC